MKESHICEASGYGAPADVNLGRTLAYVRFARLIEPVYQQSDSPPLQDADKDYGPNQRYESARAQLLELRREEPHA